MLTESNERAEAVDSLRSTDVPAHRLPSKNARRTRSAPQRADRSLASALNAEDPVELDGSATTLQARLSYELYSGNPTGDTDKTGSGTTSPLAAKVTCEVYGASRSGTEAKVTFSVLDPEDAAIGEGGAAMVAGPSPDSGNPTGDTDLTGQVPAALSQPKAARRQPRAVVVEVHIPRQDAGPGARVEDSEAALSRLVRPFGGQPMVEQLATPT